MENEPKSNSWNLVHLEYGILFVEETIYNYMCLRSLDQSVKSLQAKSLVSEHSQFSFFSPSCTLVAAVHVNLLLVVVASKANTADIVVQNDDMILNQLVVLLYSMCMTSVF